MEAIIGLGFWVVVIGYLIYRPIARKRKERLQRLEGSYDQKKEQFNRYLKDKGFTDPELQTTLRELRAVNEEMRRFGRDNSAEIDGLERAWKQKKEHIAAAARQKKEAAEQAKRKEERQSLMASFKARLNYFDLRKQAYQEELGVLYENEWECFRAREDILSSLCSVLEEMGTRALGLAQLDPPINVSAQLAQREVICFDTCIMALLDSGRWQGSVGGRVGAPENAARPTVIGGYQETIGKEVEALMQAAPERSRKLAAVSRSYDYSGKLAGWQRDYERTKAYLARRKKLSPCGMMVPDAYGQVNKELLAAAQAMTRPEAETVRKQAAEARRQGTLDSVTAVDPRKLFAALWFFAMEKPHQAADLAETQDLCSWYFNGKCPDVKLAEWYAQRQMGGADAIARVDNEEFENVSAGMAEQWASGLMWIQGYRREQDILQKMLEAKMPMSPKAQERLHALNNGGGKAPDTHEAVSGGDELSFDVSALSWRDEEYNALFESLAFQDKKLTYGLAVRDEDKDLLLPAGVQLPGKDEMLKKFQASLAEEYGGQAAARNVTCVMLSGSGRETMEGVLVTSRECRQLGVAVNLARIGKKVNLKFYTLFLPDGLELAEQKQQAISLCKKMSPSTTMWENSLKSTMLLAIQQVLNSSAQGGGQQPDAPIPGGDGGAPVF